MPQAKPVQDRIAALPFFGEVMEKLRLGWSIADVARIIQEERSQLTSISRKSMEKALLAMRNQLPPGEAAAKLLPGFVKEAAEKIEDGLNEVDEMWRLYKIQLKRIEINQKNEENLGLTLNTAGQEIRIAKEILDSIGKRKGDLGLRAPTQVEITHSGEIKQDAPQVVLAVLEDSEKRSKVLGLAKKLAKVQDRVESLPDTLPDHLPATSLPVVDAVSEEIKE